jgi:hypothetical protein
LYLQQSQKSVKGYGRKTRMTLTKKQLPFGSRPNLFLKSHQNLVFRQEKVQILKVFRNWIFGFFHQDNEGFRDRQHFF